MKILGIVLMLLFVLASSSVYGSEETLAEVFFYPEQSFLRVNASFMVSLETSALELTLFPGAQVTSIWIPGMQSYAVDRRPSATRITVMLRSQPQTPQPLEISYEGTLSADDLASGRLGEESLWFPQIPDHYTLSTVVLEFAPDSTGQLVGDWEAVLADPGIRRFRRQVTEEYPILEFTATLREPDDPKEPLHGLPDPGPSTPDDVVEDDEPVEHAEPLTPAEPDEPAEPVTVVVPLSDRTSSLLEHWQQDADLQEWQHYFVERLQQPTDLRRIAAALDRMQRLPNEWYLQRIDDVTAASFLQAAGSDGDVEWRLTWRFLDAAWYVTEVVLTPMERASSNVLYDSFELWLDRLIQTPWTQESLWWDRSFADENVRQSLAVFIGSIGTIQEWQIQAITHGEHGHVSAEAFVAALDHRFLLRLHFQPVNQYWQLRSFVILPL